MMNKQTILALAAAMLLSGATAASAANTMAPSSHSGMSRSAPASDTLNLTSAQQKTAWRDLNTPSLSQTAPSGFDASVGAVVPSGVTIAPMPTKAAGAVPVLRPYDFAMVGGKVLIVNPSDKKIAEVITG